MSVGVIGLSVFAAAWLALCVWTARRLLFRADPAARKGVLKLGVPLWLGLAAANWIGKLDDRPLSPWTFASLAILLVIGFPFAMWMGHVFSRMFASPSPRRSGRGER